MGGLSFARADLGARFFALPFRFSLPTYVSARALGVSCWALLCPGVLWLGLGGVPLRLGAWDFFAVLCCSVCSFSAGFGDTRGRGDDTRGALGGGDDLWCWWWSRHPFCMDFASSVWSVSCVVPPFSCFRALLVLSAFCALLRLCFVLGTCFALFACAT